jgi:CPA1 family monovalent cation:H+ antiporter
VPALGPAFTVAAVVVAGSIVWRVFQRTGISVFVAISLAGVVAGAVVPERDVPSIGPGLLGIVLPALIFEAAWNADAAALRRAAGAIAVLAVPGVLVTAAIVAGATRISSALDWGAALVLGAIVAATDPVSVLATFRRLALPRLLVTIVEGEAVANDGVALVLTQALLPLALSETWHLVIAMTILRIIAVSAGGIAAGCVVAIVLRPVMRARVHGIVHAVATVAAAYGSYAMASAFGGSGIFAAAAAGVALRGFIRSSETERDVEAIDRIWDAVALALNAVVFALVGLTLRIDRLGHEPGLLAGVVAAVVAARCILAYGLVPLRGLTRTPLAWRHTIALAGLRGGLSLALAIGLPQALAARDQIRDATFAVVFVTLILQGPLIAPLLRRLSLDDGAGATQTAV